uniref:uncharacterized protein LOC120331961 n=1 Tax=Styela clava TaxID=7725 RepID=UPI001939EA25|nr:uncharacterized protein LOC120331961 [Styela clava]XP_039255080.1 uncharacterized protein LOC120331961 [Styela clava]XP_039255081.1 uncharacterized protein LOC120331961 [Styela clava]
MDGNEIMKEDGSSSEGIVISSDEEYYGLSKAVEHHITMQEKGTTGSSSNEHWRSHQPPKYYGKAQHAYTHHHKGQYEIYHSQERQMMRPRSYSPIRSRSYSDDRHAAGIQPPPHTVPDIYPPERYLPPTVPPPIRDARFKGSFRTQIETASPSAPRHYIPPDSNFELIRRSRIEENRLLHPSEMHMPSSNRRPPTDSAFLEHRTRPALEHIKHRPYFRDDVPNVLESRKKSYSHDQSHSFQYPEQHQQRHHLDVEPLRTENHPPIHPRFQSKPPKPVAFKIKAKTPPKLRLPYHPLDPFSPLPGQLVKDIGSPKRWSHDKYEQDQLATTGSEVRNRNDQLSSNVIGRHHRHQDLEDARGTKAQFRSPEKLDHLEGQEHHKKIEEKIDGEEMVYEIEEEFVEIDETSQHENPNSDDDEELLGLRLQALTSALNTEERSSEEDEELLGLRYHALSSALNTQARTEDGHSTHKRDPSLDERQKPKFLVKRVMEGGSGKSKKVKKGRKKSDVADLFMKKHSSISKHQSPERARPVTKQSRLPVDSKKPNKAQLTLFSEIVKNHQAPSKTDALRYIRSHPDENIKTEMFLNLMKRESLSVPDAVDLAKQNFVHKKTVVADKENIKKDVEPVQAFKTVADAEESNFDNYDEIEMELSEGESDSGLVPPGTDDSIILPPKIDSTGIPALPEVTSIPVTESKKFSDHDSVTSTDYLLNATPSQESIWMMLENPIESEKAKCSGAVTGTDDNGRESNFVEKRARISSGDIEIDDDSLIILRERLLKQMDSNKKEPVESTKKSGDSCVSVPSPVNECLSSGQLVNEIPHSKPNNQEIALLPSQYPYQPPTLQTSLVSKINSTNITADGSEISLNQNPVVPPFLTTERANQETVSEHGSSNTRPAGPCTLPSSQTEFSAPQLSMPRNDIPASVPILIDPILFTSSLKTVNIDPRMELNEETKAAIALSAVNLTSSNFKNISTTFPPSLTPINEPQPVAVRTRAQISKNRRKRRSNRKLKAATIANKQNKSKKAFLSQTNPLAKVSSSPSLPTTSSIDIKKESVLLSVVRKTQPVAVKTQAQISKNKRKRRNRKLKAATIANKQNKSNEAFSSQTEPQAKISSMPSLPTTSNIYIEKESVLLEPATKKKAISPLPSMIQTPTTTGPPTNFVPQLASTPALPLKPMEQTPTRPKRAQIRQKLHKAMNDQPKKLEMKLTATTNASPVNANILKPFTTNIATISKTHPSIPVSSKPTLSTSNSQTLFKSATTIIKKNHLAGKRAAESLSDGSKRKVRVLTQNMLENSAQIRLPRHQPVVIEIGGSSDEDESVLSPTRTRPSPKNPFDLHRDMLDAMIKQVRQETTLKQKSDNIVVSPSTNGTSDSKNLTSRTADIRKALPLTTDKQQNVNASVSNSKPQSDKIFETDMENVINSPKAPANKKVTPKVDSPSSLKSLSRQMNQIQKHDSNSGKTTTPALLQFKQAKIKFLKLKTLIGKDEVAYNRLVKIKESKKSELRLVQDELKEMIYRVAAIKGKAARCEELVKRYTQQETKMKEKLEKRNDLKMKLKERIKRQMILMRSEQRRKKNSTISGTTTKQSEAKKSVIEVKASPNSKSKESIDQEKKRLLAVEQKLVAKINQMKKSDGKPANPSRVGSRRVSLSQEVQSQLEKHKEMQKTNKPSVHDLSLSKIAIPTLSPVRNPQTKSTASPIISINSPARKLLNSPSRVMKSSSSAPTSQEKEKKTIVTQTPSNIKESNILEEQMSSTASEVSLKRFQKIIEKSMNDIKSSFLGSQQPFAEIPFSNKSWDMKTPDCFKRWKIDIGELLRNSKEEISDNKTYEFKTYQSPLHTFRSYRLNPFMRTKDKLSIKSATFSHKINPEKILCRYGLTGTCHDPNCRAQHSKQYELQSSEVLLDLICYCPELLGENASFDSNYQDLIKLSELTCNKLCGISGKQTNMSIDEKCILIASKVNTALNNKAPFTTIFKPRIFKPMQNKDSVSPVSWTNNDMNEIDEEIIVKPQEIVNLEHPDSFIKDEERYFIENEQGTLSKIEAALKRNPHDIQLWLELSYRKMSKASVDGQSSLELALHTMCLALEENPYVGELWGHYLGLLRRRKGAESNEDLDEMVTQAIELVPLSPHVWNQLLSWDLNVVKREFLYDQLISNLLKNIEGGIPVNGLSPDVTSRWLLQTVLQRTQLQLLHRPISEVLPLLKITVKEFSQQCQKFPTFSTSSSNRCLTSTDLNHLWLAYFNVVHFNNLPQCFFPNISSACNARNYLGIKVYPGLEVQLDFNSRNKL